MNRNEWFQNNVKDNQISLRLLSDRAKISTGMLSKFNRGINPINDQNYEKLKVAFDDIIKEEIHDMRYRKRNITKEHLALLEQRKLNLVKLMDDNGISQRRLAASCGMAYTTIRSYYLGTVNMNTRTYNTVIENVEILIRRKPPKTARRVFKVIEPYVLTMIREWGNTIVSFDSVNGKEQSLLEELRELGYDCSLRSGDGHYIVERN